MRQAILKQVAIGQSAQLIVIGQVPQALLGTHAISDVVNEYIDLSVTALAVHGFSAQQQ